MVLHKQVNTYARDYGSIMLIVLHDGILYQKRRYLCNVSTYFVLILNLLHTAVTMTYLLV
jgi:hypothetical protein